MGNVLPESYDARSDAGPAPAPPLGLRPRRRLHRGVGPAAKIGALLRRRIAGRLQQHVLRSERLVQSPR